MKGSSRRQRLDEILLRAGLVTKAQIREALMRQRAHGGKFGSQLLYHRHIDEVALVQALAMQHGCEGVMLSELKISPQAINQIPKKIALSRKVIPFEYHPEESLLRIACEDPEDQALINELEFIARGKEIKLYVAPELVLNTTIAKYYLDRDVTLEDSLLLAMPKSATAVGTTFPEGGSRSEDGTPVAKPAVLLVTDETGAAPQLQSLLERDGYEVIRAESADQALDLLDKNCLAAVFIKYTARGDYLDLVDRARKIRPQTTVRYFDTPSSLLFNKDAYGVASELNTKNLDLFTSLLCSKDRIAGNRSSRVGHYVDKLCCQLGLPDRDRLTITNAAYLHDLARFYYTIDESKDRREFLQLSAKLLSSLNYSPLVVQMLRSMYRNIEGRYDTRLPVEAMGANIITIVDMFCESMPQHESLTLDKFDSVIKRVRSLIGNQLLAEVAEAFIVMIQREILGLQSLQKASQVMIFCEDARLRQPLEMRLRNEGLRTVTQETSESLIELYQRSEPDIMILVVSGSPDEIMVAIGELAGSGINFERTPTFLLVPSASVAQLTGVLEHGIEDVIAIDDNLDLLVAKVGRLQVRLRTAAQRGANLGRDNTGARGRLADMNLIDLLQALGPSRRTVKMTVESDRPEAETLTIYLELGDIIFAQYENLIGAQAIYEGLTWADGRWRVTPISSDQLPVPNNHISNESILMEGCRLMDEKVRCGQTL